MSKIKNDEYAITLGKEVPIGVVDQELRMLWEENQATTNASLINLAVYSEAKDALLKNSAQVEAITREHACRALLIAVDHTIPKASIRAWVKAHCHLSYGRKGVCCEQIAFQLTGQATGRLRNTVFSHLSSDLPLVFWWQGELSSMFSERLYSLIDRFIFDSSEWADPYSSFRAIERVMNEVVTLQPMDLEWARSYQIRQAIAGLFDDPLAIDSIERTSRIRIVVHPDHKMAGLQLLAWIIESTGWQRSMDLGLGVPCDNELYYFETNEGVDVTAVVEVNSSAAPVALIELSSSTSKVRVKRECDCSQIHQDLDASGHVISRCAPAGSDKPAELVMELLSHSGENASYRMMMPTFLNLLGEDGSVPRARSVR